MAGAVKDQDAGRVARGRSGTAPGHAGNSGKGGKAAGKGSGAARKGGAARAAGRARGRTGARREGALFCLCLAAREAPDVDVWSSLRPERAECPRLYRKSLAYLKSALDGFSSAKGIKARLGELDSMIDMTGGADGGETLGDRIALAALEILRTGFDALDPEFGAEAMENAERLYLSLSEHALRGMELDDSKVEEALDGERSLLGALRRICKMLRPASGGGANAPIIKLAIETATEDGASGAGIEAAQPAFA